MVGVDEGQSRHRLVQYVHQFHDRRIFVCMSVGILDPRLCRCGIRERERGNVGLRLVRDNPASDPLGDRVKGQAQPRLVPELAVCVANTIELDAQREGVSHR